MAEDTNRARNEMCAGTVSMIFHSRIASAHIYHISNSELCHSLGSFYALIGSRQLWRKVDSDLLRVSLLPRGAYVITEPQPPTPSPSRETVLLKSKQLQTPRRMAQMN